MVIKSSYSLSDGGFVEETYSTSAGDPSLADACDQAWVIISEPRKPGLGSLATSGDLTCSVRSVGRATLGGSDDLAPALILLELNACSVLTVGPQVPEPAATSRCWATERHPAASTSTRSRRAATGQREQRAAVPRQGGRRDHRLRSTAPTGTAGIITSVASNDGKAANVVADALANVYGTTATAGTGVTKSAVTGLAVVGRGPVDSRYRFGVRQEIAAAQAAGLWTLSAPGAAAAGWTVTDCSPTGAPLNVTTKLYVDCPGNSGITLNNKTIKAAQFVKGGTVSTPKATRVYVNNTDAAGSPVNAAAVSLSNNTGFCVRGTCDTTVSGKCSTAASSNRAVLIVRQGHLDASGGLLRLCYTTAILLGGYPLTGCVPGAAAPLPTDTPCSTTGTNKEGNTRIDITGGAQLDWTAPNNSTDYIADKATRDAAWRNDLEDPALWSES